MDLSLVIPCYNEADNVPKIRNELLPVVSQLARTLSVEVVFVDDGSKDNTQQVLTEAMRDFQQAGVAAKVEHHPINKGVGAALSTGFAASHGNIVVTTDSDGTYKFSQIPDLLACLKPDIDIVTGSPYHPAGGVQNVPRYRLILSQGASIMYRVLASWQVHTYTALFRAYRREVIERVPFESDGFLAGTELMVNAMLMGYQVGEYPAVLHSRQAGASKAKVVRIIRSHLKYQWRVLLWRLGLMPLPRPIERKNPA
jgi:dolichol-phosphate mannosyltransferase